MKKQITFNLNESEMKVIMRLVEAQRELSYHLLKFKEAQERKVEELKHITAKAQEVQNLKRNFDWNKFITLSEEEKKSINCMLQSKHIRV